jgi:hypothetical protein
MNCIDLDVISDELLGQMAKDSLEMNTLITGRNLRKRIITTFPAAGPATPMAIPKMGIQTERP